VWLLRFSVSLLLLVGVVSAAPNALVGFPAKSETNAQRFSRGLAPLPPRKLFNPTRVGPRWPQPSPLPQCVGYKPPSGHGFLIEVFNTATDVSLGFLGVVPKSAKKAGKSFVATLGDKAHGQCFGATSGSPFAIENPSPFGALVLTIRPSNGNHFWGESPGNVPGFLERHPVATFHDSEDDAIESIIWKTSPDGVLYAFWRDALSDHDGKTFPLHLFIGTGEFGVPDIVAGLHSTLPGGTPIKLVQKFL